MQKSIIIVSGLPRSGTSLMMQMLEAGGIPVLMDTIRKADENNPNGYYELESVKKLASESDWLADARGKAVKVISHLLRFLPKSFNYKIIFLKRDLADVVRSQNKMLTQLQKDHGQLSDLELIKVFNYHLKQTKDLLSQENNIQFIEMNFEDLLLDTLRQINNINSFLGLSLEETSMAGVIDRSLNHGERK